MAGIAKVPAKAAAATSNPQSCNQRNGRDAEFRPFFVLFNYKRIIGAAAAFVIFAKDALGNQIFDIIKRRVR